MCIFIFSRYNRLSISLLFHPCRYLWKYVIGEIDILQLISKQQGMFDQHLLIGFPLYNSTQSKRPKEMNFFQDIEDRNSGVKKPSNWSIKATWMCRHDFISSHQFLSPFFPYFCQMQYLVDSHTGVLCTQSVTIGFEKKNTSRVVHANLYRSTFQSMSFKLLYVLAANQYAANLICI